MENEMADIQSLLAYASKFPLLKKEQEHELITKAQAGDKAAKDKMIYSNIRLVVDIANSPRYLNQGIPLSDLIIEGCTGITRALEKFEVSRNLKFSTYATQWIHQRIKRALENKSRLVRIPIHIQGHMTKIGWATRKLIEDGEDKPTAEQLAVATGFTVEEVKRYGRYKYEHVSLDKTTGDDNLSLGSFLSDEDTPRAFEMEDEFDKDVLWGLIDHLETEDREFIILKYGLLNDGVCRKDKELAVIFNLKLPEVKKRHDEIIRKLKQTGDKRKLNMQFVETPPEEVNFIITSISDRLEVIGLVREYYSQRYEYNLSFKNIALLVKDLPAAVLQQVSREECDNLGRLLEGKATWKILASA